ncbi:hypothetical protein AGMMS50212_14090 [Spirochaetia bacterium]|nr:hypothetical protein AGMMS50212_14090 [Spirochaetia bacterium]
MNTKDWKEHADVHYSAIYKTLDPNEISKRCNLSFDEQKKSFSLCLMGEDYQAAFPEFSIHSADGSFVSDESIRVLLLRYLCEGKWSMPTGKKLSYRDIPWGEVYFSNFEGRCIKRVERTFGNDINSFNLIFEKNKNLKPNKIEDKECGWRFEFFNGFYMSIIIWQGDDEFPSKAQILFDDNFPSAFSAEDIAVIGDISINKLKLLREKLCESK